MLVVWPAEGSGCMVVGIDGVVVVRGFEDLCDK